MPILATIGFYTNVFFFSLPVLFFPIHMIVSLNRPHVVVSFNGLVSQF